MELQTYEPSGWRCLMFGATGTDGLVWAPAKGNVPNRFVRWMMKVFFACTWERV